MSNEPQQLLGPLSQELLRDFPQKHPSVWRDRTGNWSLENMRSFSYRMRKPPWWRPLARWKWRKLKRNMLKPQPALSGWKVIDCRNAPGHLSDVVFEPELVELTAFTSKDVRSTTAGARYEWDEETKPPSDEETK